MPTKQKPRAATARHTKPAAAVKPPAAIAPKVKPKPSTQPAMPRELHGSVLRAIHASSPDPLYWCGAGVDDFRPDIQQAIFFVRGIDALTVLNCTIGSEMKGVAKITPSILQHAGEIAVA